MHEFQVQSDNAELTDYIIDIINHRQKVTIVKKKGLARRICIGNLSDRHRKKTPPAL